ncbi:MAG: hypothetical protein ABR577_11230 [Pyrinomonadaceae bacterium]
MSEEEMQRKMEFIVEQQAQFTADIQLLKERDAQAEVRMAKLEEVVLRLANAAENRFGALNDALNDRFATLTEAMTSLATAQQKTETKMAELAVAQAHTDQRLDALIDIIRAERNGESQN